MKTIHNASPQVTEEDRLAANEAFKKVYDHVYGAGPHDLPELFARYRIKVVEKAVAEAVKPLVEALRNLMEACIQGRVSDEIVAQCDAALDAHQTRNDK